jgi:hypothetical protein
VSAPISAARIAEHALRQIGAYSTNDDGADPAQFDVALDRLDLLVAELASSEDLSWLVTSTTSVVLVAGTSVYSLAGLEHVSAVRYTRSGRFPEPVELVRHADFVLLDTDSGDPQIASVTRAATLSLNVWPTPAASQAGITLLVTGQSYTEDLTESQGSGTTGLPAGWARWLIYLLAADLGSGPIHMLSTGTIQGFEQRAGALKARLMAHSNRPQIARPRFTRYRDF